MEKVCTKCEKSLPLDRFNSRGGNRKRLQSWCRACIYLCGRNWRARHPEKIAEYERRANAKRVEQYATDPAKREYCKKNTKDRYAKMSPEQKKEYHRRGMLWTQYRMRQDDFDQMVKDQKGRCAVCRKKVKTWIIDHCHDTGKVRGLVCRKCNNGLGSFNDNPDELRRAVAYLEACQAKLQAVS